MIGSHLFYRMAVLLNIGKFKGKFKANRFKTNADQRCYKRIEYGIAGRKNQSLIKLTYLCIHLTYMLCWCDSQVSKGCLQLLKMTRIIFFVFVPTELVLFNSKFIFFISCFTSCYWFEYFLVSKSVGITKVIKGQFVL